MFLAETVFYRSTMKHFILLVALLLCGTTYAQFDLSGYSPAKAIFRNGDTIMGIGKITFERDVKFKHGKNKETLSYRTLDRITLFKEDEEATYTYKILAGKEPRLLQVVREYPGSINLYAIENEIELGGANNPAASMPVGAISVSVGLSHTMLVTEYYANKGTGIEVFKLGDDHPVFGKKKYMKAVKRFFKDCPEVLKSIEEKGFRRTHTPDMIDLYHLNCGEKDLATKV